MTISLKGVKKVNSYFSHCANIFFWLKESIMHPAINSTWQKVNAIEAMSRIECMELQKDKLCRLLSFAASQVPFYRDWFAAHNVALDSLSIGDFPVLEKKDIRGSEALFVADGWQKRVHWTRTSGSTGEPFRFARSEYDYAYASLWRGLARWGVRPGDKRALVKGVDETAIVSKWTCIKRKLYEWINRCIVVDAHFLAKSDRNVEHELYRILKYKPDYFHGYVSSIYLLACYAESHNLDCSQLRLKAVVTESEKCHSFQREVIERVFHAPVVENYGSVEFGMIAQPAHDGRLCINEDHVYVETNSAGEAIFTNLDEYGFPLIRFKNGDKIAIGDVHTVLPYRTFLGIEGRITETIKLPQGGELQGYVVMYPISKHSRWMKAYQIYQPSIDEMIIRIVLLSGDIPDTIVKQMISEMRAIVGSVIKIRFEYPAEIPLTSRGKRLFICSDVK